MPEYVDERGVVLLNCCSVKRGPFCLLVSMGCLGDLHHKKMGDLAAQKTVVGFDGLFGRLAGEP